MPYEKKDNEIKGLKVLFDFEVRSRGHS